MSNRIIVGLVGLCASLACVSGARAEVVIETVTVGHPGNANDIEGDG